ncbi:MAG: cytochrome P450 [Halioglobus sp.]
MADPPAGNVPVVDFNPFTHVTSEGSNRAWRELREQCPVAWTPENGGHWILSSYEAVTAAFLDWQTFSSARTDPAISSLMLGDAHMPKLYPEELDPPASKPMRRVLSRLLSPTAVAAMEPRVQHWTNYYLDRIIDAGGGDFASEFSVPVPSAVTMEWLGWPQDEWVQAASTFYDMARHEYFSPGFMEAGKKFRWLGSRIQEEVAQRRQHPRDDVMSAIANADLDGVPITAEEAQAMVLLTIGGGVDTTTALTSAGLIHLGRDPELRSRIIEEPALLETATEGILRLYPPARTHARTASARDIGFHGCPCARAIASARRSLSVP